MRFKRQPTIEIWVGFKKQKHNKKCRTKYNNQTNRTQEIVKLIEN